MLCLIVMEWVWILKICVWDFKSGKSNLILRSRRSGRNSVGFRVLGLFVVINILMLFLVLNLLSWFIILSIVCCILLFSFWSSSKRASSMASISSKKIKYVFLFFVIWNSFWINFVFFLMYFCINLFLMMWIKYVFVWFVIARVRSVLFVFGGS